MGWRNWFSRKDSHKEKMSKAIKEIKEVLGEYPVCPHCEHRWHRRREDMRKIAAKLGHANSTNWVHCTNCGEYYSTLL